MRSDPVRSGCESPTRTVRPKRRIARSRALNRRSTHSGGMEGMSHNPWRNRSVATLAALVTVALIAAAGAQSAGAQEDESVHVSGEVDVYVETYSTNFAGDYNGNTRGESFWGGGFSSGLPDAYSNPGNRVWGGGKK